MVDVSCVLYCESCMLIGSKIKHTNHLPQADDKRCNKAVALHQASTEKGPSPSVKPSPHFSGPSIFNVLSSGASTLFSLFSGGGGGAQDRIGVADDDGEGGSTTTYSTASYGPAAQLVVRLSSPDS